MSFLRLTRGHLVAALAALALLVVMAGDWYTTAQGEESRRIERLAEPEGTEGPEEQQIGREQQDEASRSAEEEEQNAWQADGAVDRLVLIGCLATVGLALLAAALQALGRRYRPPSTPSGAVAFAALFTLGLLAFRMIERTASEAGAAVAPGAFLGISALGLVAFGGAVALRTELSEMEVGTPAEAERPEAPEPPTAATEARPGSREDAAGGVTTLEPATDVESGADPDPEAPTAAPTRAARRLSEEDRRVVLDLAATNPRDLGKPFDKWTLGKLASHLQDTGAVDRISASSVGRILRAENVPLRAARRPERDGEPPPE